jgi:hypothetical protein
LDGGCPQTRLQQVFPPGSLCVGTIKRPISGRWWRQLQRTEDRQGTQRTSAGFSSQEQHLPHLLVVLFVLFHHQCGQSGADWTLCTVYLQHSRTLLAKWGTQLRPHLTQKTGILPAVCSSLFLPEPFWLLLSGRGWSWSSIFCSWQLIPSARNSGRVFEGLSQDSLLFPPCHRKGSHCPLDTGQQPCLVQF